MSMPPSLSRSPASVSRCSIQRDSEGIAEFLGATPVIDDATLVVTERFRLVKADDSAHH